MPRLLAVCAVASPGGAEIALARLLRRLAGRGWAVTLATPGPGPLRETARREGWGWERLAVGGLERGAGARAVASFPRARVLAARHDVVLFNGGVAARLLPAVPRSTRKVLWVHDMVERIAPHWRGADVVMTPSDAAAARLRPLAPEVVGAPVELDPPPVAAPWRNGGGAAPVIGFVGRLEPRKAPLDLVRAAPAIRRARPDARIVLVGNDPFERRFLGYAEAVRAARIVEHYPWVDDAAGLMRHVDVLVVPSREEPFGMVAAEALAVGTPVVATRVGGLPALVQDGVTGALVDPGRPIQLATATVRVLSRRDEMRTPARRQVVRFGPESFTDRVERLLAP